MGTRCHIGYNLGGFLTVTERQHGPGFALRGRRERPVAVSGCSIERSVLPRSFPVLLTGNAVTACEEAVQMQPPTALFGSLQVHARFLPLNLLQPTQ